MNDKQGSKRFDVFISYARPDRFSAEKLYELLSREVSTFLDTKALRAGDDWDREVARAQRAATLSAIILSQATPSVFYSREEVAAAIALAREDPLRHRVVPIYLDGRSVHETNVPYGLRAINGIVLNETVTLVEAARELCALVHRTEERSGTASELVIERPAKVWNVPSRSPDFTGRADLLAELKRVSMSGIPTALTNVVSGLGGIGKTQLAVEYAYRNRDRFSIVWWVRASDQDLITRDLSALAPHIGVSLGWDVERTAEAVRDRLAELDGPWLLVIDDARDREAVERWIPRSSRGQVIITSRTTSDWGVSAHHLMVDTLSSEVATEFLMNKAGSKDREGATRLAARLGGLPVALDIAARYVLRTAASFDAITYRLDKSSTELEGESGALGELSSITVLLEASFETLERSDPKAAVLLQRLSLLADAPVPLWLLEGEHDPGWRTLDIEHALEALEKQGLVSWRSTSAASVHPLVKQFVRGQMPSSTAQKRVSELLNLLLAAFPATSSSPEVWHLCADLIPHLLAATRLATEGDSSTTLTLLDRAIVYRTAQGDLSGAENVLRLSLGTARHFLGDENPDTLTIVSNLALTLRTKGELNSAQALQQEVLERYSRAFGEEHPATLGAMSNLASTLSATGELNRAR